MIALEVKPLRRGFACLLVLMLLVSGAWAINVNVNQDTFVLSNEAPGYLITQLINAGCGDYNLYQTLVQIVKVSDPSVSDILTPDFLVALQNNPAGSQIFTTLLKDVSSYGVSVSISTDGSARHDDIEGRPYMGTHPTLVSNISGVG